MAAAPQPVFRIRNLVITYLTWIRADFFQIHDLARFCEIVLHRYSSESLFYLLN
jgi:hypothetical protein